MVHMGTRCRFCTEEALTTSVQTGMLDDSPHFACLAPKTLGTSRNIM